MSGTISDPHMPNGDCDNLLCSQVCGHILAIRLVKALGMDVLALLPPQWRRR